MFKKMVKLFASQKGEVNIGSILMFAIAFVFLAVGFIMLPQVTDATSAILDYSYSANTAITDATYTGLTSIAGIIPLLTLLGYLTVAVVGGFLGVRISKGEGSAKVTPGGLIMLALSLVFVGIGLLMFPIALDGISSVAHGGGNGISSSFTGFQALLYVAPMLSLLGFVAATVILGFFGVKSLSSGDD
jgi:hypothetical protein